MNIKHYIIAAMFSILANLNIVAQNSISGNVKDIQSKENLPGVSIYIADLETGTTTDVKGNYRIENLKPGVYLFNISFVGYKSIVKSIDIRQDTVINFLLRPSVTELNEVVVTGVARSTELKMNPVAIKTVNRNSLDEQASTNLIDGLKSTPGVSQITTGAAISKPLIRGLGYNRVITLDNGIRQEGQQWGDEHGIEIDEYAVGRVEIIKGPGSLMYGSDGIAGVLNFLSPKMPPMGEMRTRLISNYQTNNNLIGYSFSNAGNKNGFQWLGRFSRKIAGNYQNRYDGKVYNSGFKETDGSLFVGINKNWGHSFWTISSFNQNLNLVEGERDSLGNFTYVNANGDEMTASEKDLNGYKTGFPHQEIHHIKLVSNNYFLLKKGSVSADFAVQNNQRKEFGNPVEPDDIDLFFDLRTFNYNIRYNFERIHGWETSVGAGGMYQSNANKGEEFLIPAYHLFDAGVFVFTQRKFGKINLAGGLRFDNRNMNSMALYLDSLGKPLDVPDKQAELKFSPFRKNYNGFSGSIGLSWQANQKSTLKFNLSRGYRAPNIAELASNGRHEGTFRYEIGNPDLMPETSHQTDLSYLYNSAHTTLEVSPFVNFIDHYIYVEKLKGINGTDSIPDPGEAAPAFRFTAGNARLAGGEIYVDVHPHPLDWLHIENSFSYVQAVQSKVPDSMKYLPFIPAPKYTGEIKAQWKEAGKIFSHVYVKFGVEHFFKQDRIFSAFGTETETPAYTLLNAGAGAYIHAFHRKDFLRIYVSAGNLLDVAYQNHLSRLKYAPENVATGRRGVFNMGRNVSIKLIMNL